MPRNKRKPSHDMARRLEAVRGQAGLRLTEFRKRLLEDSDYEVSYQAVQNYHFDRPAPIDYLARVAEVFGADFTYLATGRLPPRSKPSALDAASPEDEDWPSDWDWDWETHFERLWPLRTEAFENTRFFGPLYRATGYFGRFEWVYDVTDNMRFRAGRPVISGHPEHGLPGGFTSKEEMEKCAEESIEADLRLDTIVADAWDGTRELVAHAFGPESIQAITLDQQMRFAEQMVLALTTLVPDHGKPPSFKEKADG